MFEAGERFGDIFKPERGELVPSDLIGATILAIGAPTGEEEKPEGGGLLIDYAVAGNGERKRIILAFNELGMWIEKNHAQGVHSG